MRRRDFIGLLGGAAAWPFSARAQQAGRLQRVGVLLVLSDDPEGQARAAAFDQGLREHGWLKGGNLRVDYRWAGGETSRLNSDAAELVKLKPDVLVAGGGRGLRAFQEVTKTIPIVFVATDNNVVENSIVNLARPRANATGFTIFEFSMTSKLFELLKRMAPRVVRVVLMGHPDNPSLSGNARSLEDAARAFSVQPIVASVRDPAEIEGTIEALASEPNSGLIVPPDQFMALHREGIVALAARAQVPAVYGYRPFVAAGGLMSYGPDIYDLYRRAASYVDRILRGARPDELPVQTPTKYEFVINLKTAGALGLTVPPTLLALADEVIE